MKALDCPSCGAPISLKKGIKIIKCSFCENEIQPDYESADEFEGLTQKKLDKYKKRADAAFERGLLAKAFGQYLSLAELLKEDYENYEIYIPIKVRCHTCKIKVFLLNYSVPDGETLVDIQNRAYTADINNPPEFYYARIDGPMMELIEDIEDECEKMKELEEENILEKGTAQSFAIRCYVELKLTCSVVIGNALEHIYLNCSYARVPGWNQYASWIDEKALSGPVYLGLQLNAEYLGMFMRFLELIDLGENYTSSEEDDSPLLSIRLWEEARNLIPGINLYQVQIDKRHPREDYKLTDIRNYPSVREFFDSFEKLDKKLAPAKQGAVERERQKKEKEKLEAEQKRIQAEKERKEYEASPEYAQKKRDERYALFTLVGIIGILVIIISAGAVIRQNEIEKEKRKALIIEEEKRKALIIKEREIMLENKERARRLEERRLEELKIAKSNIQRSYNELLSNNEAFELISQCSNQGSKYSEYYSFGMVSSANSALKSCLLNKLRERSYSNYKTEFGMLNNCITEKYDYNWRLLRSDEKVLNVLNTCLEKKKWNYAISKNESGNNMRFKTSDFIINGYGDRILQKETKYQPCIPIGDGTNCW